MYLEKQSPPTPKAQLKKSLSSCFPCFLGSPVVEFQVPAQQPPADAGSKRKLSAWFTHSGLQNKKKTKTIPVGAPAKAAADLEAIPAADKSASKKPSAKGRTSGSRSDGKDQQHARISMHKIKPGSEQTSLLDISQSHKHNARRESGSISKKRSGTIRTGSNSNRPETCEHAPGASNLELSPFAGIWLMAVTLAVVVFSGRAAAVICLCSCLYLSQLMRAAAIDDRTASRGIDMESDEYKKRVVMDGLLQRDGRRASDVATATICES